MLGEDDGRRTFAPAEGEAFPKSDVRTAARVPEMSSRQKMPVANPGAAAGDGEIGRLFPGQDHDHTVCISAAQERAERAFQGAGFRMTPLRARVLREVAASHGAIGAYDILERISADGKRMAPISVYRALDTLVAAGVVHKLESRNAFFACRQSHVPQRSYLVLLCSGCGQVAEAPAGLIWAAIDETVRAVDFAFEGSLVEVVGRCGVCCARSSLQDSDEEESRLGAQK